MAIADRVNSIKEHLGEAYVALEEKGATLPQSKNIENLSESIMSIPKGGSGEYDVKYDMKLADLTVANTSAPCRIYSELDYIDTEAEKVEKLIKTLGGV